jgi:predicted transcriptional regulator
MAQFTTAEVAEKFETTPRTLRKFLRADARANGNADNLPGKGSRYSLEGKDLAPMRKRFKAWTAAEAEARAARAAKAAEEATAEVDTED